MKYILFLSLALCASCAAQPKLRRLASLDDDLKSLDKDRKTVCTVTLNSDDEKKAFRAKLKNFNFLELAERDPSGDWLKSACEKKVQCDILLISGHFGGTFFGKSGLNLPLPKLEELSCSNSCPGIFEHPKEVFLMGCNTLAGKRKDRRTPEEYVRVLMADGFTRQQAEQVAAARYSVIGSSNAQRMRMAFTGPDTKLYGFDSIAPSGKSVDSLLQSYLASVPGYDEYLNNWNPKAPNDRLAEALKITSFTQSLGGQKQTNNPACVLGSKDRPNSQKLAWINEVLADPAYALAYIPNIAQYFSTLNNRYRDQWPAEEKAQLASIQQNQAAKTRLLKLVEKPLPGILSQQAEILNFSRIVGWLDNSGYAAAVKGLIGNTFERNLTLEQKDSICSAGVNLDIGLHELPTERWNENTVQALACLRTKDPAVAERLSGEMQKPELPASLRMTALRALASMGPLPVSVQQKLIQLSASREEDISINALYGLAGSGATIEPAHLKLISFASSPNEEQLLIAIEGLKYSRNLSLKAQRAAIALLKDENVPNDIYDALGPNLITSPVVQQEFFQLLRAPTPPSLRVRAMWVLWSGGWNVTPELKRQMALNVGDADEDVRGSAGLYFMQEDREDLSEEVEHIMLKLLRTGSSDLKIQVLTVLSGKGTVPRPETQVEMLKAFRDANADVRRNAYYGASSFCAGNSNAVPALTAALSDKDADARNAASVTLKGCTSH